MATTSPSQCRSTSGTREMIKMTTQALARSTHGAHDTQQSSGQVGSDSGHLQDCTIINDRDDWCDWTQQVQDTGDRS